MIFIDMDQVLRKVVNSNVDLKVDVDVTNVNLRFTKRSILRAGVDFR